MRLGGVVELEAQTVAAEYHADDEEQQQGGHTEFVAGLAGNDADKK